MKVHEYDRIKVVEYAKKWAYSRNPAYYDFSNIGGDCTNFVSQCIFAGANTMNYAPVKGWYYNSISNRSPAWTGVDFLYNFLIGNNAVNGYIGNGHGPFAELVPLNLLTLGDVVQLSRNNDFFHTAIVVGFNNGSPLVSSHSRNTYGVPLSYFSFDNLRYLHIIGVRK